MRRPKSRLLPFLLLCAATLYGTPAVVDTGHQGAVTALAYTSDGGEVLTGGRDGTVRRYDSVSKRILGSVQVSPFSVAALAVHPELPRVAVVESDGVSLFLLSVWDLETERRVYSLQLEELPLSLAFSPQGTYLIYSRPDWESIVVLDADRGTEAKSPIEAGEPRFPGFGIVDAFLVSESENTLVAYLLSGSLQYRHMDTGQLKTDTSRKPTLRDMDDVTFLSDGLHAVGTKDDEILVINIVSGRDVDSVRVSRMLHMAVDPERMEIVVLYESGSREIQTELYALSQGKLARRYSLYDPPSDVPLTAVTMKNRAVFFGTESGVLYSQTRYQREPLLVAQPVLEEIHAILPGESTLITTADSVVTLHFDVFPDGRTTVLSHRQDNPLRDIPDAPEENAPESENGIDTSDAASVASESAPGRASDEPADGAPAGDGGRTGVRRLGNRSYLLFQLRGGSGDMVLFSPISGLIQEFTPPSAAPLTSVDTRGFDVLTVNSAGELRISDLLEDRQFFTHANVGLRTAVFADGPYVIAAGHLEAVLRTTTHLINTDTYETIPLQNRNTVTFALAFDGSDGSLYSASIDHTTTPARTIITRYSGEGLERADTVYSRNGEFYDATIAARHGTVFFSVGGENYLKHADEDRFYSADPVNAVPRSVHIYGDWLFSVNRNGSASLWNATTGDHLADYFRFTDGEWIVLSSERDLIAVSDDGESHVVYPRERP